MMSLSRNSAFAALALSLLVLGMAPDAFAQSQPKKPQAAQPAQPAQPAPAAQPAPQGPAVVQVQPEPTQADWIKICGEDQAAKKKVCYTTRDFVSDQNQPVLAVAVYDVQGEPQKTVRFLLPLGFMLAPGVRFNIDQGPSQPGKYAICFPNGCFAEVPVKDDVIAAFKKGQAIMVSVQNQFGREVVFQVPLLTFGKVFDGPPIDPAVLAAEQKKMQDEMQRQAEEMRKKMGQQAPAQGQQPQAPAKGQQQVPAQ